MDTAVEQFRSGASTFQEQLEALIASVTAERNQLAENSEKLKFEREAYEQEKQRVSQVQSLGARSLWCIRSVLRGEPLSVNAGVFWQ